MLVRVIPWKMKVYMYIRENIDPRYLGLHVHLGVLECSKPNTYFIYERNIAIGTSFLSLRTSSRV